VTRLATGAAAIVLAVLPRTAASAAPASPEQPLRASATQPARANASPAAALSPAEVLGRYAAALRGVAVPHAMTFDYTVEQTGPRNLVQTHRIYRQGEAERDETLAVDGYTLKKPAIRIIVRKRERYAIARLAPKPGDYVFRFLGVSAHGRARRYVFSTTSRKPGALEVVRVEIDGRVFLPARIDYRMSGRALRGTTSIAFARVGSYWLVREAVSAATLAGDRAVRERIAWSVYAFPPDIPAAAFTNAPTPRPVAAPLPIVPAPLGTAPR